MKTTVHHAGCQLLPGRCRLDPPATTVALLAARWNHSPSLRFGVNMIADLRGASLARKRKPPADR
jgi:hypothetical protein